MLMVVVQATFAGVNVFYKLAANDGMSLRVLVAYRFLFAFAFSVPVAIIVERGRRPELTWKLAGQEFLLGLLQCSANQNLYLESLVLTSATFASAMTNLVPAITFVLAIYFGLEKLGWGTMAGKAKVAGTLMFIGGAMLLTFYKGVEINLWSTDLDLLHSHSHNNSRLGSGNLKLGAFLSVCYCFSSAVGSILQATMIQDYKCPCWTTAMAVTMGAIQSVGFAVCMERDWEQWKLGWNIRLLSASYSGIVASGVMMLLTAWCVKETDPLFVSVFNPLMLVLVAIAGSLLFDEKLHLGSVLGAGVIVLGIFTVLWGKAESGRGHIYASSIVGSPPTMIATAAYRYLQRHKLLSPPPGCRHSRVAIELSLLDEFGSCELSSARQEAWHGLREWLHVVKKVNGLQASFLLEKMNRVEKVNGHGLKRSPSLPEKRYGVQNPYVESLALTSAKFTAAMTKLIPVITFMLVVFMGVGEAGIGYNDRQSKASGHINWDRSGDVSHFNDLGGLNVRIRDLTNLISELNPDRPEFGSV
ncbi:WAT1-related protein At1g25270-like [Diospyros lotus]|uniref:WAT1-related protein At1g25270-like n=1 Tax=Diospyros lotus TaxID=55363 RepID=UPI00224EF0D7|nr:WAT1-related protein At1g25270-like [Diospyros lotus]